MQGRKPSTDEVAERIELCRSMLLRRVPKSTIKKAFRQRFGAEIDHGTIERYLTRREAMLTDLTIGRQFHRANVRSPTTNPSSLIARPRIETRPKPRNGSTNCWGWRTSRTSRRWRCSLANCPPSFLNHFAEFLLNEYDPTEVARALQRMEDSTVSPDMPPDLTADQRAEWVRRNAALRADPTQIMSLAGLAPDPWQNRVLETKMEQVLLLCSRQVGKSTVAGALAMRSAILRPGALILLLSPSLRQSGNCFGRCSATSGR